MPIRVINRDILSKTVKSHIYHDAEQNRSKVKSLLPRLTVLKKSTKEVLSVEYLVVYNKRSKFIHVTFASHFSYVFQSGIQTNILQQYIDIGNINNIIDFCLASILILMFQYQYIASNISILIWEQDKNQY